MRQWRWRYTGRLAGNAEARQLGGEGLTQVDFARGTDGALLALLTPDHWDAERQDLVHHGCRVIEVASLDPPRLARDASGKLRVRAVVTASDLAELGPGASAYDPASVTGILFVRRDKRLRSMTASIHSIGVGP